jgi:hypothetical protein
LQKPGIRAFFDGLVIGVPEKPRAYGKNRIGDMTCPGDDASEEQFEKRWPKFRRECLPQEGDPIGKNRKVLST